MSPGTQSETIKAAAPNHLVFKTASRTENVGVCSLVLTVQSLDAYDNVSDGHRKYAGDAHRFAYLGLRLFHRFFVLHRRFTCPRHGREHGELLFQEHGRRHVHRVGFGSVLFFRDAK